MHYNFQFPKMVKKYCLYNFIVEKLINKVKNIKLIIFILFLFILYKNIDY